jgi:2-polyprenyl-3-methyl-5-hydroxy-6-metoxy-1,4-benzoquinol methylase
MNVLEIGCGTRKQADTNITIDKSAFIKPDIVRDVAKRGIPFADNTFDKVYSFEVIEHIDDYEDLIFLLNEIWRVLIPDGIWHFSTPNGITNSFNHLTHSRGFTRASFEILGANLEIDWEAMRKSDGIEARYSLGWEDNPSAIIGKFKAIK